MPSPAPRWTFGPFILDPANACLWRGTEAVALPPKVFDVLHYLVLHPDRLVPKDELLDAVWPETAVSEAVVRIAIGELRRALGDTAQASRYLATVQRRGYRFVAPVVEHTAAVPGPTGAPAVATPDTPHPHEVVPRTPVLPPPEAERRHLTILFCDLVGSTALAGRLDPEDYREVVRAYHRACAEVMQRFDGYLAQYLGDGVLGYFGYPVAHEDDAQRAVRAGLDLLDACAALNPHPALPAGEPVAVRLGVHTGLVVVGDVGAGTRHEALALGETPNIAARLHDVAEPNTLVISAATQQLIAGYFRWKALGAHTLPGLAQPLEVYRVLGPSGAQSRLEVAATYGLTPLVGRAQEVGLLLACWTRVTEGMGQVVLLQGEAGIGKSRLVQVLQEHVAGEGQPWLECQGSPYYQHTALYPLTALLARRLLHGEPETTAAQQVQHLEAFVGQHGLSPAETVPLLAPLLSLPLPATYAPVQGSPEQQRQQTLYALLAILLRLAAVQPLLLVMEDVHWVDPTTLELLSLLVDQGPTARILTLVTCRPDFTPPWTGRSHYTQVTLARLPQPQVAELTRRVAHGKALPAEVGAQIVAKADGVPLFVEEVTRMVLESGLLQEQDDRYALTGALPALAIPTTLHDSLLARLDRLGAAKGLAQLGATLGRDFAYALLRAVAPWDDETLHQGLHQLVAAELLYQRGLLPQATYTFKHALIQDAAYQSLLRSTRQQYHQRIAQVLAERFPETAETQPEVVAQHYTAAGLHAQALPYWQRAGQRALARSAYREAVACLEQALSALPHLPETRDTREQAIDLRLALRSALQPSGDSRRMLAALREAEVIAEALADPRRLAQVTGYLSFDFCRRGLYDQASAAARRALVLATASGEVILQALANQWLGRAYFHQGEYRRAIACFGQTEAAFGGALRHEHFGAIALPAVHSRAFLACCHAELGSFTEGRALGEEGLRIAGEVNDPASLMVALWGIGLLALRQGDLPRALPPLERAMGICQDASLPVYLPLTTAALGEAYTLGGRIVDALPLLTQAMAQVMAMERVDFQALSRRPLGEAQLLAGRLEEAHVLAERTLALAHERQERADQAYALRLLGDIAARRDSPESELAEAHYQQALALAEELGMRPLQAHCHRGLGMLYVQAGQQEQAHAVLTTALKLYRAMDMAFWLPETEAALAQVDA